MKTIGYMLLAGLCLMNTGCLSKRENQPAKFVSLTFVVEDVDSRKRELLVAMIPAEYTSHQNGGYYLVRSFGEVTSPEEWDTLRLNLQKRTDFEK